MKKILLKRIALFVCVAIIVILHGSNEAQAVMVPVSSLPSIKLVKNPVTELVSIGCVAIYQEEGSEAVNVPKGHPFFVAPQENTQLRYACPITSANSLQVTEGRVLSWFSTYVNSVWENGPIAGSVKWAKGGAQRAVNTVVTPVLDSAKESLIWFMLMNTTIYAQIGSWLIMIASLIFQFILVKAGFISHSIVRTGWPFLQGLVNLGFVLALLFLAVLTTLRVEIGGASLKKMIPRFLLAAILINFSLVIGGLIIDASRIVMASLVIVMTKDASVDTLGVNILEHTSLVNDIFAISHGKNLVEKITQTATLNTADFTWNSVVKAVQALIIIYGVALSLWFLTAAFLVRYIVLLLLLAISPLAYLAMALPGTMSLTVKWWRSFIKWTLFGPAAIFVLVMITKIKVGNGTVLDTIIDTIIVCILLVVSVLAGKYIGGAGGNLSVKAASKLGAGAARLGAKGIRKGAKGAYISSGARRYVGRPAKSLARGVGNKISKKVGLGKYSKYDKKDVLRKDRSDWGSRLARSKKEKEEIRDAKIGNFNDNGPPTLDVSRVQAWNPAKLRKPHVGGVLNKDQREAIMNRGSHDQKMSLVNNISVVKNMTSEEEENILNLDSNTDIGNKLKNAFIETKKKINAETND